MVSLGGAFSSKVLLDILGIEIFEQVFFPMIRRMRLAQPFGDPHGLHPVLGVGAGAGSDGRSTIVQRCGHVLTSSELT